jgi:hypothetical protein
MVGSAKLQYPLTFGTRVLTFDFGYCFIESFETGGFAKPHVAQTQGPSTIRCSVVISQNSVFSWLVRSRVNAGSSRVVAFHPKSVLFQMAHQRLLGSRLLRAKPCNQQLPLWKLTTTLPACRLMIDRWLHQKTLRLLTSHPTVSVQSLTRRLLAPEDRWKQVSCRSSQTTPLLSQACCDDGM